EEEVHGEAVVQLGLLQEAVPLRVFAHQVSEGFGGAAVGVGVQVDVPEVVHVGADGPVLGVVVADPQGGGALGHAAHAVVLPVHGAAGGQGGVAVVARYRGLGAGVVEVLALGVHGGGLPGGGELGLR